MGKRVTGRFFRRHVVDHGIDACSYLLAVDVDMTPLPGYGFASWETGYGDMLCRPDLGTLRVLPWLDKTAIVLCDLFDEGTGEPVEVAPRQILRRQVARAREAGYTIKCGSELGFLLFRDSYEEAASKGYLDVVRVLVERGADVCYRTTAGTAGDSARASGSTPSLNARSWAKARS